MSDQPTINELLNLVESQRRIGGSVKRRDPYAPTNIERINIHEAAPEEDDVVPPPVVTTEQDSGSGDTLPQLDLAKNAARGLNSMLLTAGDAATLGAVHPLYGLIEAFRHTNPRVQEQTGMGPVGAFQDATSRSAEFMRGRMMEVPTPFRVAAELVGAATTAGPIDDALAGGIRAFQPKYGQVGRNVLRNMALSYPLAVSERYWRDDVDFDEAIKMGAFDTLVGGVIGASIGTRLLPNLERLAYSYKGPNAFGELAQNLTARNTAGGIKGSLTLNDLNDLARQLQSGEASGKLFEQGFSPQTLARGQEATTDALAQDALATQRLYNHLSTLVFDDVDPRKVNLPEGLGRMQQYTDLVRLVNDLADNANMAARNDLDAVFSPYLTPRVSSANREAANELYFSLGRMELPDGTPALGATPVDAREIAQSLQESFGKSIGRNDFSRLSGPQRDVWNSTINLLRGDVQEEIALGVRRAPVTDPSKMSPEELEAVFPSDLPVMNLLDMRKGLADMLAPGGSLTGTGLSAKPLTREHRNAVTQMLKHVDEEINKVVGARYGDAKADFAQVMRENELERLGAQFYSQRRQTVEGPDARRISPDHYGESLEEFWGSLSAPEREAFRHGWANSMIDRTGKRSLMVELRDFFHTVGDNNVLTASSGREHLKLIFGEDNAAAIERIFRQHNENIVEKNEFRDALQNSIIGQPNLDLRGIPTLRPSQVDPADSVNSLMAGLAAMRNFVKPSDTQRVAVMQMLLSKSDEELGQMLEYMVRSASPGQRQNLIFRGVKTTQGLERGIEDSAEREERLEGARKHNIEVREENVQDIMDYLESLDRQSE